MATGWETLVGAKRIAAELRAVHAEIAEGSSPISNLTLKSEDDMSVWSCTMAGFDADCEGGRLLNADLLKLLETTGQGHLQLEISFPPNYPTSPFFVRVVTPRCVMYTGHVTAGGSVCMEMLSGGGSHYGWHPSLCVVGIMPMIKFNMINVPVTTVRTAAGGGVAGPLRVDFATNTMQPYSEEEARQAFRRAEANHRARGW